MSINDQVLPWTDLTFEQARSQLSAFHFSMESLAPGERQILYIAEGLLRLVDPESYGIVLDDLAKEPILFHHHDQNHPILTCENCGVQSEDVVMLFCGYAREINGEDVLETICDKCEDSHLDDI